MTAAGEDDGVAGGWLGTDMKQNKQMEGVPEMRRWHALSSCISEWFHKASFKTIRKRLCNIIEL
jgi:hypothetical protein